MARSLPRSVPPLLSVLLITLVVLLGVCCGPRGLIARATAASCPSSDTFEVPIEQETGDDDAETGSDDGTEIVIDLSGASGAPEAIGVHAGKKATSCNSEDVVPSRGSGARTGFGVVPGTATSGRRLFLPDRAAQAARDARSVKAARDAARRHGGASRRRSR